MAFELEPLFRQLAEHSLVGIYIIQDDRYSYVNPRMAEIFGYSAEELLALDSWLELVAVEDRALVAQSVRRRLAGEVVVERYAFHGLRKDGTIIDVEVYGSLTQLNGRPAALGNLIDITERNFAKAALRQSEELFQRAFEDTNLAMVLTDIDNHFIRINRAFARMFGYAPDEMLGMTMAQITHPDDLQESYDRRQSLLAGKANFFQMEKRYIHRDGRILWGLTNVSLVRDSAARPAIYFGQVQDITERRRLQAERDDLLARLQLQIKRMPLAYLLFDAKFCLTDWNPAATNIFGYRKEEVSGMGPPFEKLVPAHTRPHVNTVLDRLRAGDMAAHSVNENLTKDGRTITCQWFNTPLVTPDGRFDGLVSLVQDVTEHKRMEAQLRQAQKMEAIGALAGGVAHDFNNLLTVINGYSEVVLDDLGLAAPARDMVREIHRAGDRASTLTRQLLAFSRKQVLSPQVVDLNALVREMAKMLRRLIGENIALTTALTFDLAQIRADPGQIEQVVMNPVVNARDAMPNGGKLTIETENAKLTDEYCRRHVDIRPGRYARLAVTDTGIGMDEATRTRIFEPFFTTKEAGKGTGLGLSTVHGIVRQSGGHVEVYSQLGRGTTFKIYLPALAVEKSAPPPASVVLDVPRGTETVMLAEDDDSIRMLARIALQSSGYSLLEAANGHNALKVAAAHSTQIHLLVTDVIMPGMSGRELADQLRQMHSGLRVLYVSGYADHAIARHGIVDEGVTFLQKPFTPTTLARKVREVLDASASRYG